MAKKIKVVFVLRFLFHYRIDPFERINAYEDTEVTVIHGRSIKNTKYVNFKGKTEFENLELKTIQYTGQGKFVVFFPFLFFRLVKLNPDVIITEGESNMLNNIFVYIYSILFNKKILWWSLGLIPNTKESLPQRIYKPLMKLILKRASYIIGYSEYTKDYYSQQLGFHKTIVANNCLDNESIDREIEKYRSEASELKQSKEFSEKFVILYVGAFVPGKKVDKLLKAYYALKSRYPNTALILIGEGPMKNELETFIETYNIKDVCFPGKIVNEVSKYFLAADLFVLPGLGGLSIHHAMTHSLPVIAASADGTEMDLIKDDMNGFLLKTDTVDELSDYLNRFLEDTSMSKRFGSKSREIVDNQINIKNMVSKFHEAILKSYNNS
jgi:glycosyltransferase involved in cell wall biosynthesis